MNSVIEGSRIIIRPVEKADLKQLIDWWNDGRVMSPVGFPEGLGLTMHEMISYWKKWNEDPMRFMKIICLKKDLSPIGETNFHDYSVEDSSIRIGLKICLPELWGKGLGTEVLSLMINHAFEVLRVRRVLVNPAKTNRSIIRVNEKCGFTTIGGNKGSLLMELERERWLKHKQSIYQQG